MDMKHDPNHGHCIDQLCCLGQTIEIMYLLTRCRPYCCDLSKWFITVSDHDTIWSDNIVLCDWECRWARQCRKWKCQGKRERRRIRKKGFSMPVLSFHIWQGAGALWAPQLTQGSQFSRMSSKAFVKWFPRVRHSYAVSLDAPLHCRAWKPSGSTWLSTGMKCLYFFCPIHHGSYHGKAYRMSSGAQATHLSVRNVGWGLTVRVNLAITSRRITNRCCLFFFSPHWPIVLKVVRHSCPICNKGFYRSSDCKVMRFYPSVSFIGVSFCRFTSARIQKLRNFLVKLVEKVFPMSATWTDTREFTPKRSLMYVLTVEKGSTKPPPCKITKKSILPTCSVNVLNAQKSSRLAEFY